jgi:cyclic pyranopterin monophosphate synthase
MITGNCSTQESRVSQMVDVGDKPLTRRRAVASGKVRCNQKLLETIVQGKIVKGNLLEAARLAGIQAAKQTSNWLPYCHPLPLDYVRVEATMEKDHVALRSEVGATWKTGVEMEALTAVAAAALTVIDMGKSIDKTMVIDEIRIEEKSGGRSGDYRYAGQTPERLA